MIKKMIVGGALLIIGIFLIIFQLKAIDQIREKDQMLKIYTISDDVSFGQLITNEMIHEIYIRKEDSKKYYLDRIESVNYYALSDKKKGAILFEKDLSTSKPIDKFLKDESNNIITLALGIEEANAWDFDEYDKVDLYFVSNYPDKENVIYEDIIVYKIRNSDPFRQEYSDLKSPQYVSLLVPKEKSYDILSNKRYGRFEIIIN